MRNLKKCIYGFYEWIELPEQDIHALIQLQLISPTGRTLAGAETNETLRKGSTLFSINSNKLIVK
ncbi:MAG: hypothetical protein M0Q41_13680 [Bacteroidales bacterium]|nr:hypothetical protein [Bacteroidales bacterium]